MSGTGSALTVAVGVGTRAGGEKSNLQNAAAKSVDERGGCRVVVPEMRDIENYINADAIQTTHGWRPALGQLRPPPRPNVSSAMPAALNAVSLLM